MVNLGPCHTTAFLFENAYFLTCIRRSSRRPNTLIQTGTFESGFKSGVFRKRTVLKRSFLVWTDENGVFGVTVVNGASVHLQVYLDCSVV